MTLLPRSMLASAMALDFMRSFRRSRSVVHS